MSSATTYTTKAGNLWALELGASADCWVRQADRGRPPTPISATDTGSLEIYDAQYPISLWFRLGSALGLRGDLTLLREGNGLHTLYEGDKPVHVFANGTIETDLPVTVVAALLETDNEPGPTAVLEAILAVVEAAPRCDDGAPWLPGAPIDRNLEYEVRRIDGLDGLFHIRDNGIRWVKFKGSESEAFIPGKWSDWECRPLPALGEVAPDIAALHGAVEDRIAALNEEAWTGSREQADLMGALNHPDEKPGQVVYTYEPPEPHPAIARIDAILDRALADLEPRPEDAPRQRRTNRDLADLGALIRDLTTARGELKR